MRRGRKTCDPQCHDAGFRCSAKMTGAIATLFAAALKTLVVD